MEVERWLDHPIIRYAQTRLPAGYSTLDLLTEALGLMLELEERFPGVAFDEVLASSSLDADGDEDLMRQRLEAAGISQHDVCLLLVGGPTQRKYSSGQLLTLQREFESRTCSVKEFCRAHEVPKATLYRLRRHGWAYPDA